MSQVVDQLRIDRSHMVRLGIMGGRKNTKARLYINFAFET